MKYSSISILFLGLFIFTDAALAQGDGRNTIHLFPQFADGRFNDGTFYRSALIITNPSPNQAGSCTGAIHGMTTILQHLDGSSFTGGTFSVSIASNSWGVWRSQGTASFQSGYLTLSCTIAVNALVIYSYHASNGLKLSEAAVFSSPLASMIQILSDQRDGARLGIAIINDQDAATTVLIVAGNSQGQTVGTTTVSIRARSQYVGFLDQILPAVPSSHIGQVVISSSVTLAAIGLRFTGAAFTTT